MENAGPQNSRGGGAQEPPPSPLPCPPFKTKVRSSNCFGLHRVAKHPGVLLSLFRQSISSHMEQALQSGQATLPREAIPHLLLTMVTPCLLLPYSLLCF